MQPRLISISRQYIDLFDTLAMGGVQFDNIHTLQLDGPAHFPDSFYHTILGLCSGVSTLRMNYHKAVGILAAIVKDDEGMLPKLEYIYMDINESDKQIYGVNPAPAEVLANWVKTRQRKASASLESTKAAVCWLKTVFVQFYHTDHPEIVVETMERIKLALGKSGVFVWRLKESSGTKAQKRQKEALEQDINTHNSEKGQEYEEKGGGDDSDSVVEEPANGRPFGWSAGPW
jgi:hypothetical protein